MSATDNDDDISQQSHSTVGSYDVVEVINEGFVTLSITQILMK